MPPPDPTVDEIAATIKRSNLFNVVVEGRDDVVAFRVLERRLHREGHQDVALISAGGRSKLLSIFRELADDPSLSRCAFICDKDEWVFCGVPDEFNCEEVIKTDGYSIENDLLRDYPPEEFMDQPEQARYRDDIDYFMKWFTIEMCKVLAGTPGKPSTYTGVILNSDRTDLAGEIAGKPELTARYAEIKSDPARLIRGKSLMEIVMRQLSRKGRAPRHNHLIYIEHSANAAGQNFMNIFAAVLARVVSTK